MCALALAQAALTPLVHADSTHLQLLLSDVKVLIERVRGLPFADIEVLHGGGNGDGSGLHTRVPHGGCHCTGCAASLRGRSKQGGQRHAGGSSEVIRCMQTNLGKEVAQPWIRCVLLVPRIIGWLRHASRQAKQLCAKAKCNQPAVSAGCVLPWHPARAYIHLMPRDCTLPIIMPATFGSSLCFRRAKQFHTSVLAFANLPPAGAVCGLSSPIAGLGGLGGSIPDLLSPRRTSTCKQLTRPHCLGSLD